MNGANDILQDPLWFLKDEAIVRRIVMAFDKPLFEDDVCQLLGVSRPTLSKWIKEGTWRMAEGPDGRRRMTLAQFREQFALTHKYHGR